jgi:hypothetical protein
MWSEHMRPEKKGDHDGCTVLWTPAVNQDTVPSFRRVQNDFEERIEQQVEPFLGPYTIEMMFDVSGYRSPEIVG